MSKYFTFFSWHNFGQIPKIFEARKALKIFEILNTIFVNRYFSNFSAAKDHVVHDTCVHYCGFVTYHVIHVLNSEDNSNKNVWNLSSFPFSPRDRLRKDLFPFTFQPPPSPRPLWRPS